MLTRMLTCHDLTHWWTCHLPFLRMIAVLLWSSCTDFWQTSDKDFELSTDVQLFKGSHYGRVVSCYIHRQTFTYLSHASYMLYWMTMLYWTEPCLLTPSWSPSNKHMHIHTIIDWLLNRLIDCWVQTPDTLTYQTCLAAKLVTSACMLCAWSLDCCKCLKLITLRLLNHLQDRVCLCFHSYEQWGYSPPVKTPPLLAHGRRLSSNCNSNSAQTMEKELMQIVLHWRPRAFTL